MTVDSIVKVHAKLFKKGPVAFAELEDYVCGREDTDWEDIVEDYFKPPKEESDKSALRPILDYGPPDCLLTKDTFGFQFECFGEGEMTGVACEVEAVGWAEVVESNVKELVEIAKTKLETVPGDEPEVTFLTIWHYAAWQDCFGEWESECYMLREFSLSEIKEENQHESS